MNDFNWDAAWTSAYTGVSSETPSGRLLRQYWHPVLLSVDIPPRTIRKVQLLGEDLVIFRLANGSVGIVPEHCAHRGASLAYGFLEEDGIRCAYHGWKFSVQGEAIETPFGCPVNGRNDVVSMARAYECGGIVFVSLNPGIAESSLPRWDLLTAGSGEIVVQRHVVDCNWFQYQENAADVTHTYFLHGARLRSLGIPDASNFYDTFVWYAFSEMPFGFVKAWLYEGRAVGWGNLAIFPNILRIVDEMHWRVPLDAGRTLIFQVAVRASTNSSAGLDEPVPAVAIEDPPVYDSAGGGFRLWSFQGQDAAACATQGRIAQRDRERLAASDYGLVLYRKAWQALCDAARGPHNLYKSLRAENGVLGASPWLSVTDIAVSRPVTSAKKWPTLAWHEVFPPTTKLVPVPRGAAGRGPLG